MANLIFSDKQKGFLIDILKGKKQSCFNDKIAQSIIKKLDKKRIKVSSAKSKGRALQYWVCMRIAKMFGIDFVQSDDECPIHSREMGQHGTDIVIRDRSIREKFPFSIECKNCESFDLNSAVKQSADNTKSGNDWVVVHKNKTIKKPVVIIDWDTFERIISNGQFRFV